MLIAVWLISAGVAVCEHLGTVPAATHARLSETCGAVNVADKSLLSSFGSSSSLASDDEWVEPICRLDTSRFVLYPIKQHELWNLYKKHVASFWTAEEIDLGPDRKDWLSLSDDERHFISTVLAFFASSDGIVVENLAQRFCRDVQLPEVILCHLAEAFCSADTIAIRLAGTAPIHSLSLVPSFRRAASTDFSSPWRTCTRRRTAYSSRRTLTILRSARDCFVRLNSSLV